ncbi:hypothetical protein INS49_001872 [Diaporthe citri]|uniref:uncharacterized protein n=1 Tax=Diaporthe citri TaxID=83186 RepID=UPI001C7FD835|nr:uncharacterized protein INS49_001872 [Diaporthe citri]KAG6367678.1 hypothetical protein INS49_001872 [Diaporthe citri]
MVVKIRLARFGRTNSPFYNIVVAHARQDSPDPHPIHPSQPRESPDADLLLPFSRTARNSKPLEVIGTYDPIPKKDSYDESGKLHKDIRLDVDRAKYWVGVGAQPTDTVWRFLSMLGILEPKYRPKAKNAPPPLQTDSTTTTSI